MHLQEEYWYIPPICHNPDDEEGQSDYDAEPRYHYPSWEDFTNTFCEQFHDPTAEEMHEARLGEIKMGNGPATVFFCTLKQEAKLAGQRNDESDQGTLVHTIQQGIPPSYASIILNIRVAVL